MMLFTRIQSVEKENKVNKVILIALAVSLIIKRINLF